MSCCALSLLGTKFLYCRQRTGEKRDDFLQLMLEARAENEHTGSRKIEITDDVIIAQALVFLLGGFDTVEVLLNCALYELALNPDVQDRLYKEVTEASAKEGGLTYEAINSCEYLNMIVSGNELNIIWTDFVQYLHNKTKFLQRR